MVQMAVDVRSALVRLRTAIFPLPTRERQAPAQPLRARDFVLADASFPLVYVMDITGWSGDDQNSTARFTLTNWMSYGQASANLQCTLPYTDGDLFDKKGAYVVVLLPAHDRDRVQRILRAAGKESL
jgi:hypothetical protein